MNDGQAYDQVVNNVREALKQYLWSLPPDGPNAQGWPLGRPVQDRELEVVVARVDGVNSVAGINLFKRENNQWQQITRAQPCDLIELPLQAWQLPELLAVVISTDGQVSNDISALPDPIAGSVAGGGIAVPIVPEVC